MKQKTTNNIKLGMFVIAGGIFLVVLLYMIGRKETLFGSTFLLKARFENVQGLVAGNNVRFSGIQAGTVKSVNILNDTTIEVVMRIERSIQHHIRQNAIASIGTEGFIGNKVVNIIPSKQAAASVEHGFILSSKKAIDPDEMLKTLEQTNKDIAAAAANLKLSIHKLNSSDALWQLLNDQRLPANLNTAASNIQQATANTKQFTVTLNEIINDIQSGKGNIGTLINDTMLAAELNNAATKIKLVTMHAEKLVTDLDQTIGDIRYNISDGNGMVNAVLKDSVMVQSLANSLKNIEKGTASFNQNMEALKSNILFRGYFRKLEKQNRQKN